jgi:60S ribosome subunit biogenesis protein NIP7
VIFPWYNGLSVWLTKGFGVTARSTTDSRKLEPTAIAVFHQEDVGVYLREEDTMF